MPATESMPATTLTSATVRSNINSREASKSEYTAGMRALGTPPKEMPATLGSNRRYASNSSVVHSFAYVYHFGIFDVYLDLNPES
jgi:hypothetical protein